MLEPQLDATNRRTPGTYRYQGLPSSEVLLYEPTPLLVMLVSCISSVIAAAAYMMLEQYAEKGTVNGGRPRLH